MLIEQKIYQLKMAYNKKLLLYRQYKVDIINTIKHDNQRIKFLNQKLLYADINQDIVHVDIESYEFPKESRAKSAQSKLTINQDNLNNY